MWKDSFRVMSALLLAVPVIVSAQTLIEPDAYRGLTSDRHGYRVGETLTILVVESTTAESAAGTAADSRTNIAAKAGTSIPYQANLGISADTSGNGQTSRRGQIRTNVSVRIVEQLSGGLLRVQGEQLIAVNDEKQRIRITGLVRPDDINYDNTVFSNRLANAVIEIIGDGVVSKAQEQNIFFRVLKWLHIL